MSDNEAIMIIKILLKQFQPLEQLSRQTKPMVVNSCRQIILYFSLWCVKETLPQIGSFFDSSGKTTKLQQSFLSFVQTNYGQRMRSWYLWISTRPGEMFSISLVTPPMNSRPGSTCSSLGHVKRATLLNGLKSFHNFSRVFRGQRLSLLVTVRGPRCSQI